MQQNDKPPTIIKPIIRPTTRTTKTAINGQQMKRSGSLSSVASCSQRVPLIPNKNETFEYQIIIKTKYIF